MSNTPFSKKKFTSVYVLDIWRFDYYRKVYIFIVISMIVIEFLFSTFIWFFSASFCSVYQNSYEFYFLHILEGIVFTMAFPFLFSLLPSLLRYRSLVSENKRLRPIIFEINFYVDILF